MSRYFFNVWQDDKRITDHEGIECNTLEAAEEEAIASARELMAEALKEGRDLDGQIFEVTNDRGVVVTRIPFKKALPQK